MASPSTRRLEALGQHVATAAAEPTTAAAGPPPPPPLPSPAPAAVALSDDELQAFARDGFLVRQLTDVPAEFHSKLYADAKAMQQLHRPAFEELDEIYSLFQKSGTCNHCDGGAAGCTTCSTWHCQSQYL